MASGVYVKSWRSSTLADGCGIASIMTPDHASSQIKASLTENVD